MLARLRSRARSLAVSEASPPLPSSVDEALQPGGASRSTFLALDPTVLAQLPPPVDKAPRGGEYTGRGRPDGSDATDPGVCVTGRAASEPRPVHHFRTCVSLGNCCCILAMQSNVCVRVRRLDYISNLCVV